MAATRPPLAAARACRVGSLRQFLVQQRRQHQEMGRDRSALAVARIECHYFVNRGFLGSESQLLDDVRVSAIFPRPSFRTLWTSLPAPALGCPGVARRRICASCRTPDTRHSSGQYARYGARDRPYLSREGAEEFDAHHSFGALAAPSRVAVVRVARRRHQAAALSGVWHDRSSSAMRRFLDRRHAGGTAARLTSNPGLELFGKFSPDGRFIASPASTAATNRCT